MYLGHRRTVDLGNVVAAGLNLCIEQLLDSHGTHRILRMVLTAAWALLAAAIAGDEAAPTSTARRTVRGIRGFVAVVACACVSVFTGRRM
jgi:hypothetical protein